MCPNLGASHSLIFEIKSYLLAHTYDCNLNDKEGNATYLSPSRRCGRMIIQPMLKVSVLDASVYGLGSSIGPGLMWWKPRAQQRPHIRL